MLVVRQFLIALMFWATAVRLLALTPEETIQSAPWVTKSIGTGLTWKHCQFPDLFGAKQNLNVVTADLTQPGVMIRFPHMTGTDRQIVSQFGIREGGTAVVVNGNFFTMGGSGTSVQYYKVEGQLITPTLPDVQDDAGIAISATGKVRLLSRPNTGWASLADPFVIATNVVLRIADQPASYPNDPFYQSDRNPRTALGMTAAGLFMMVTIDGRRDTTVAAGMSFAEEQRTMAALGCRDAISLDGGGSTTMWVRGEPGSGVVNTVSGSAERPVANAVALIAPAQPAGYSWDARLTAFSCPTEMTSGQTADAWIEMRNYGAQSWTSQTKLGTLSPTDRVSPFYTAGNWLAPNRAAIPAQPATPTGAVARFAFRLTAPVVEQPTLYNEDLGLLQEGGDWFRAAKWITRLPILVLPNDKVPPAEILIESRAGGQHFAWYSETGVWADTGTSCRAPGCTSGLGLRYGSTLRSVAGLKTANFRPVLAQAASYQVYVAWGAGSYRQGPILYKVTDAQGSQEYEVDQRSTADQWVLLGTHSFAAGSMGSVEVNNSRLDVGGNMYSGCVRLKAVPLSGADTAWTRLK